MPLLDAPRGLDLASQLTGLAELHELREALRAGPLELAASGVSMRPLLRAGDRVYLEARAPRRGDIALALIGSRLVLHRVLRRRGGSCLLRGDARPSADGWVKRSRILGVATRRRDGGGWRRLDRAHQRWLGLAWGRVAPALRRIRRGRGSRAAGTGRGRRGAGATSAAAPPR